MQFVIDLIQKIPAGWPRLLTFAALVAAYFLFPDLSRKLSGGAKEKQDLDRMMQFLQMKKLLLDIEVMKKEKNLTGMEFPGEARILAELKESEVAAAKSSEKDHLLEPAKLQHAGRSSFLSACGSIFCLRPLSRTLLGFGKHEVSPERIWFFGSLRVSGFFHPFGESPHQFSVWLDDAFGSWPVDFKNRAIGQKRLLTKPGGPAKDEPLARHVPLRKPESQIRESWLLIRYFVG